MTVIFMIFMIIGIVSPQYRGALISTLYFLLIASSNISGYYSARFYKMFNGSSWLICAVLTSMAYPCFIFSFLMIINLANWLESSSATINFPTILLLLLLYCVLSVPNVWLGAFIGFQKTPYKNPGKVNKLSREIPA